MSFSMILKKCLLGLALCGVALWLAGCQTMDTGEFFGTKPPTAQPYKLTVVLDVAKNRVLTDVFRQQIEREVREGLQAALGDLATVEVVRDHPKLADVRSQGLKRALDAWKERSDVKTHFIRIDVANGQYEIQSRQYDGPTAMAGPVVHSDHTADREFVADTYSVADIAIWPWISRFEWQTIDMKQYPNVKRWYLAIAGRPAVQRGYDVPKKVGDIPMP